MGKQLFLLLSSLLCFVGCGGHTRQSAEPRPVKVESVEAVDFIERDFAGMATADDAVNLAFKIAGQIAGVDVSKGDYVKRGQILARLDPRDVELQVAADRAQYERARSQFERTKRLLEHEAVSRQEYESAESAMVQARSTFENTSDLLSETTLRAPYAGVIERTYVDTYQRVTAGQTILRLVNPISTTVEFTMPERSMALLSDSLTRFSVRFDNYPDVRFAARLHTYAKTSSDASGFPVSLKIDKAAIVPYNISPGMTCQVTISSADPHSADVAVPLTAIYAPAEGGEYVGVVTEQNSVERRSVVLGEIFGRDRVVVESGLKVGEKVVVAGVYRLREGEKVKIINR